MSKFQITVLSLLSLIACVIFFGGAGLLFLLFFTSRREVVQSSYPAETLTSIQPPLPEPTTIPERTNTPLPPNTNPSTNTPGPTATNTLVVPPTNTPTATPTKVALNSVSESTRLPTQTPLKSPGSASVPSREAEFKDYLRTRYSSIVGKRLNIEDIRIFDEGGRYPTRFVSIELTSESADIFAEQSEADALVYAENLLEDVVTYFNKQECSAYVSDIYYTSVNPRSFCDYDDEWCYASYDYSDREWYVDIDYVIVHYMEGRKNVKVWNYK